MTTACAPPPPGLTCLGSTLKCILHQVNDRCFPCPADDDPREYSRAVGPAAGGQFSIGILHGRQLLGAVGLMPDRPGSAELAYWIRPGQRGRGIAAQAVRATTPWAHRSLGIPRIWLEINPGNEPSLRVAQRAGYRFEHRLARHCRDWACEDAEHDSWHDCLIGAHVG